MPLNLPQNPSQLSPLAAKVWGSIFILVGLTIILIGAGVIPSAVGSIKSPGWVLVCAGLVFIISGAMVINAYGYEPQDNFIANTKFQRKNLIQDMLALCFIGVLLLISGWVAFGSGEKKFTNGDVIAPTTIGSSQGRFFFGLGFIILILMFLSLLSSIIKKLRAK